MIEWLLDSSIFVRIILAVYWIGGVTSLAFLIHSEEIAKKDRLAEKTVRSYLYLTITKVIFVIFWWIIVPLAVIAACKRKSS